MDVETAINRLDNSISTNANKTESLEASINTINNNINNLKNSNSEMIQKILNIQIKNFNNKKWLLIYRTDSQKGTTVWSNVDELFWKVSPYKYSIMGSLPAFYDNGWEFLLNYPEYTNAYNDWKQTSNPTLTTNVTGYQGIDIRLRTINPWGGLALRRDGQYTIIYGQPGYDNWYYAIGQKAGYNGGIPADQTNTERVAQIVELYIKI